MNNLLKKEFNLGLIYNFPDSYFELLTIPGPLIYRIHNLVNDKSYIGFTKLNLSYRFFEAWYGSHFDHYLDKDCNVHLYNAMRKYGLENFTLSILSIDPNDTESIFIKEFDSFYNGYNRNFTGLPYALGSGTEGKTWINNGKERALVKTSELDYWKSKGWRHGFFKSDIGKITIHKGDIFIFIPQELSETYLNDGWKLGTGKSPNAEKVLISNKLLNESKFIDQSELTSYIETGWTLGRLSNYLHVVNKESDHRRINISDIIHYYRKGYKVGMKYELSEDFTESEKYKKFITTPVICGFSGTLKSTICNKEFPDRKLIPSPTKFMNNFDYRYCSWNSVVNPLINLSARIWTASQIETPLVVERSMFDFIYFAQHFKFEGLESDNNIEIEQIDNLEKSILGIREYYVIDNQAVEFIKNKILDSDPNRSQVYSSVEEYLDLQEKYLSYITSHMIKYNYLTLTDELVTKIINAEEFNLPWELKLKSNM